MYTTAIANVTLDNRRVIFEEEIVQVFVYKGRYTAEGYRYNTTHK